MAPAAEGSGGADVVCASKAASVGVSKSYIVPAGPHPLDPLTAQECIDSCQAIKEATAPEFKDTLKFMEVMLYEPTKAVVAAADANPEAPIPVREVKVTTYNRASNETAVHMVKMSSPAEVVSSKVIPGVQPPIHPEEFEECEKALCKVPEFIAAMKRRGVENMDLVQVDPWSVGYYTSDENPSKRLAMPLVYVKGDGTCSLENAYARPVDGLWIVFDLQKMEPVLIEDRKLVPLPPLDPLRNYTAAADRGGVDRTDLKKVDITQGDGPSFTVKGHYVEWQKWSFRVGFTAREGVVLHTIAYDDGAKGRRNIAHRLSLSEMVVPYGDPIDHYRKNAFDEGEYGLGKNAHSLTLWSFRVGFTGREGLVINTLAYDDGAKGRRNIAHRLSVTEMIVPYGDPKHPHYRQNAFDLGECGLGKNAHSLTLGCDCLGHIHYFDAHMSTLSGNAFTIKNAVCMHEEDYGILWKHMEWRTGQTEVRRSRRLVISFICTVANYEYGFFWHLYQDGRIELQCKLTGILSLGSLMPGETRKYGVLVAPGNEEAGGVYAPYHQHFFVTRLDMSLDCEPGEAANQVYETNVVADTVGPHNPHKNAFYVEETLIKSEMESGRDIDPLAIRQWKVKNPNKLNRMGNPVAYKLVPGSNCKVLAHPEAMFRRRAGFLDHSVWVTKFDRDELFAAGEFPNQNPHVGEGLSSWVKRDANLDKADLVLWYILGITHITRPEDWPVMPCEYLGFNLTPAGFFDASPCIDVPPTKECAMAADGSLAAKPF